MRVIVSSTRPHPRPTPPASAAAGAGPVTIRPAQIGDLSSSAHLHLDALPVGLFPQLGYRFLRRWHHSFLDHPYAVAFVAVDADRNVLGFLLGTLDHRTHLSHMVRDRQTMASLAVHGIIALVARPQLAAPVSPHTGTAVVQCRQGIVPGLSSRCQDDDVPRPARPPIR